MINTNPNIKAKLLIPALDKIKQQLLEGADKYGHDEGREWTDILNEMWGRDYFLMQITKYIGRIRRDDPRSETDLFKIITYALLYWFKYYGENYLDKPKKK